MAGAGGGGPARRLSVTLSLCFRSFRTRVLAFFLGLMVLVQAGVFLAVNNANLHNAREIIDDALVVTASVFRRQIEERDRELLLAARLLSGDFAFKAAYATREHGTVLSALENHRMRIGADAMLLLSLDGALIADSLHPRKVAGRNPFPQLLAAGAHSRYGEASGVVFLDDQPFQMVVVPLLTPMPDAWVAVGFRIGDDFARGLQRDTQTHVSLLRAGGDGRWATFASTLPEAHRAALAQALGPWSWQSEPSRALELEAETYVSLASPLVDDQNRALVAVLQRSLPEALAPYRRLRAALIGLFGAGAALSVLGAALIARSVTRPVLKLVAGARRIEQGDYAQTVDIEQPDEIGRLAAAFNHMGRGLAERDRVRSLLGKVVSPAIAEELLARDIELGGEEREVTVLFSDLRGFTALGEQRTPHELLALLNAYFTRMSAVVETHGGVVDKYIGDALMALYGAPLAHADDAARAVATALDMQRSLTALNAELARQNLPPLAMGVGVNTATVVAGNMGSSARLNYTVIGDGVNLAARLESLTKRYGAAAIVSEASRRQAPGFVYRELDRVCVAGKRAPVTIHEPLGREGEVEGKVLDELRRYHEALGQLRMRQWQEARAGFESLCAAAPGCALYGLQSARATALAAHPPPPDWDGTVSFEEK